MSKGYTIQFYIDTLENTSKRITSEAALENIISPRYGRYSEKWLQLCDFLEDCPLFIINGDEKYSRAGRSPKRRLINVLKSRRAQGFNPYVPSF